MSGGPGEALDDAVELEASVEAVGEAGEVRLGVLGVDMVVGAGERGLDVAQGRVHPAERGPARGPLARARDHRAMRATGLLNRGPAGQAVADDLAAGCQMALDQPLDLLLAEAFDHAQPQPLGPALGRGLDRSHEGLLARSAPAALAARPLAAEISIIDLDPAFELGLMGLTGTHRPHQLVLHQPRGLPLDPQPAPELDRADPVLALGQMLDRDEPGGERQLGVLEHRAGGQPDLPLAAVALEQLASLQLAEAAVPAARAGQPLAPAHLEQCLAAGLLGPEPLPERGLAQALERTPQAFHRHPPLRQPSKSWKSSLICGCVSWAIRYWIRCSLPSAE